MKKYHLVLCPDFFRRLLFHLRMTYLVLPLLMFWLPTLFYLLFISISGLGVT